MYAFVITSRLVVAGLTTAALSACSGESPVAPTSAVVGAGAEHSDARQTLDVEDAGPPDVGTGAEEDTFFPGDVTQR